MRFWFLGFRVFRARFQNLPRVFRARFLSKLHQKSQIFLQNRKFFRFFAPFGRKKSKKFATQGLNRPSFRWASYVLLIWAYGISDGWRKMLFEYWKEPCEHDFGAKFTNWCRFWSVTFFASPDNQRSNFVRILESTFLSSRSSVTFPEFRFRL